MPDDAPPSSDVLTLETRELSLLATLAAAAADLAERSIANNITESERVALRNQAKLANEQAGTLLARGTVTLFGTPPGDAAARIAAAIAGTQAALAQIQKAREAIKLVTALVGVAVAVLGGDWKSVGKSLEAVIKQARKT